MPGVLKSDKPEIAGAICAAPDHQTNRDEIQQPRQPRNLQGLLQYAMQASEGGEAPSTSRFEAMSPERRQFLDNALKSMTVDVIQLLREQIKILEKVDELGDDADVSQQECAIETILEHIDHIDIANDFHKIGGFTVIMPCLKSNYPSLRLGACDVLAELTQNNPYCQKIVVDEGYVPVLLEILEKDEDGRVAIKAVHALSCILRHNSDAFNQLILYGGFNIFLNALERNEDKLRTKITFLLSTLCTSRPDVKSRLVFLGYLPVLIKLISEQRRPSHEHVLSLLNLLVEGNHTAVSECRDSRHNLRDVFERYLEDIRGKPECQEEEEYITRLQQQVFSQQNGL